MTIPALLVMEALLEEDPVWRSICTRFKGDIVDQDDWKQSERLITTLKGTKINLRIQILDLCPSENQAVTNIIKNLGTEL